MRDIKFRAFHKETKEMYGIRRIDFSVNEVVVDKLIKEWGYPCVNMQKIEIMQYTGKKDINGIEIYEGDIVRDDEVIYLVGFGVFTDDNDFQEPAQSQTGFYIADIHTDETFPFYSMRYRVIGNAYENPELLED